MNKQLFLRRISRVSAAVAIIGIVGGVLLLILAQEPDVLGNNVATMGFVTLVVTVILRLFER